MSKYDKLWKYVVESNAEGLKLTYEEIEKIAGIPLDHSFLTFKKELEQFGWQVVKISMKAKTVDFKRITDIK